MNPANDRNEDATKQTMELPDGWTPQMMSSELTGGLTLYVKAIRDREAWALEAGDRLTFFRRPKFVETSRRSRFLDVVELFLGPACGRLRGLGKGSTRVAK